MGNTQKNTPVDIQVRIDKLLDGDSSTKAFASATIGNAFAVHDIRITEKDDTAYFDYRKSGQFEWTAPAILFACLVFTLTAPTYIWTIIGI